MLTAPWSCQGRVRFLLFAICAALHVLCGTGQMWPSGHVIVSEVDTVLEATATSIFDDIERKTLVSFMREKANTMGSRSIAIRSVGRPSVSGAENDLCCFDTSKSSQRRLSLALLKALGVVLDAAMRANKTAVGLRPAESDAVNRLYVGEVIPGASQLPALVQVGVWQLAPGRKAGADWSSMIGGRGRRVVAGTSRWLTNLQAAGQLLGVAGAVPTFIFQGNKAQVLLLGEQCAEVVPGSTLPSSPSSEGLGAGIQRAMRYARSKGVTGGWPTHRGDGSVLLMRSPCATLAGKTDVGETLESILTEHRSAVALAHVVRWAQGHGALYGLPTFRRSKTGSAFSLEVITVRPIGQVLSEPLRSSHERGSTLTPTFTLAAIFTCLTFTACHFFKRRHSVSQAERDLEFVVDSL